MNFKLTDKQRLIIIISIGFAFILYGIIQAIFHFPISKSIVDNVSFVLMLVAAMLFFSGKKKARDTKAEEEKEVIEGEVTEKTETGGPDETKSLPEEEKINAEPETELNAENDKKNSE